MATVFRCDACGNDFAEQESLRIINIPYLNPTRSNFSDEAGYIKELCYRCWTPIIELTKVQPKEKEK